MFHFSTWCALIRNDEIQLGCCGLTWLNSSLISVCVGVLVCVCVFRAVCRLTPSTSNSNHDVLLAWALWGCPGCYACFVFYPTSTAAAAADGGVYTTSTVSSKEGEPGVLMQCLVCDTFPHGQWGDYKRLWTTSSNACNQKVLPVMPQVCFCHAMLHLQDAFFSKANRGRVRVRFNVFGFCATAAVAGCG